MRPAFTVRQRCVPTDFCFPSLPIRVPASRGCPGPALRRGARGTWRFTAPRPLRRMIRFRARAFSSRAYRDHRASDVSAASLSARFDRVATRAREAQMDAATRDAFHRPGSASSRSFFGDPGATLLLPVPSLAAFFTRALRSAFRRSPVGIELDPRPPQRVLVISEGSHRGFSGSGRRLPTSANANDARARPRERSDPRPALEAFRPRSCPTTAPRERVRCREVRRPALHMPPARIFSPRVVNVWTGAVCRVVHPVAGLKPSLRNPA